MSRIIATLISAALCSACFPKPEPPVMAQLAVPTVKVHGEQEVTSEGLRVTLTPITVDNMTGFPQVYKVMTWTKTTPGANGGAAETQEMTTRLSMLPLPAFQVRIVNSTGHVVRLTTAVMRLENNVGKRWQTFASTEELGAWGQSMLVAAKLGPEAQQQIAAQRQAALGGLQLLTRSVELLKGDEWTGYLAFNFGAATYEEVMNNTERFTLRLAEVPVDTNEAGQVTKTTEFTFVLDKATNSVAVVCPAGTKEPSWEGGCRRQ